MENANILFDLLNQAQKELDKIDSEIFLLYHTPVLDLAKAGKFDEARAKLWGMPECKAKFDLLRAIREEQTKHL